MTFTASTVKFKMNMRGLDIVQTVYVFLMGLGLRNRRTVGVRINDRGPFNKHRIIDLTPAAARQLHFSGLAPVALQVIKTPN